MDERVKQDYLTAADASREYPCGVKDTFGQRFRFTRDNAKLTSERAGEIMGVSRVAVSHYEKDRNFPGLEGLAAFAQATGVSLDWLVLGRPPSGQYEQRIKELPEGIRMWLLESLILAERVARMLPAEYLQPPKPDAYLSYSEMLVRIDKQFATRPPVISTVSGE